MILIDRNCWHYKVWRFFYLQGLNGGLSYWVFNKLFGVDPGPPRKEIPSSLCIYGWCFVLLPLWFVFLLSTLPLLIAAYFTVRYPIRLTVKYSLKWLLWKPVFHSVKGIVKVVRKGKLEEEPSLVWEWLKAQHRKACPLLELKEE